MSKTILITGSTDGIGLETARMLLNDGHHVLLHGRNPGKLERVAESLSSVSADGRIESYVADLSVMKEVESFAEAVLEKHDKLDVLINNAGILKSPGPKTKDGLDVRFAVNTLAPYLLTQKLLPLLVSSGRVVNLSSAAQRPVNLDAISSYTQLQDMEAYAQSKLAITAWSRHMALSQKNTDAVIVAVNPGSLLGSKMVKEGFGIAGGDISIGAEILCRAALADEFASASGQYFDNDSGQFASPHPDALDTQKTRMLVDTIEMVIADLKLETYAT